MKERPYKLTEFNVFLFSKIQEFGLEMPIPVNILILFKKQFKIERDIRRNDD